MSFHHVSVMLNEAVEAIFTDKDGTYIDCTLGGGGHTAKLAGLLGERGRIIGIDQDAAAVEAGAERLKDVRCRVDIVRANFAELEDVLNEQRVDNVAGILFDLGVSSPQIDTAARGFSYMQDARLDMRMDERRPVSAYDLVNTASEEELAQMFFRYGEERHARRIAAQIVRQRAVGAVVTTRELVEIIERAVPVKLRGKGRGHVAKRVFQALRIAVNNELNILPPAITAAVRHLKPGGRLAVITFHSLEDATVKHTLKELATGCVCPPDIPLCVCGHKAQIKIMGKVVLPTTEEIAANPRAKSAKLRVAEKLCFAD